MAEIAREIRQGMLRGLRQLAWRSGWVCVDPDLQPFLRLTGFKEAPDDRR